MKAAGRWGSAEERSENQGPEGTKAAVPSPQSAQLFKMSGIPPKEWKSESEILH